MRKIKIKCLSELTNHETYIRNSCKDIKHVFDTGIYFYNELDPKSCGLQISFSSYPTKISFDNQQLILRAINAACNTEFILEE